MANEKRYSDNLIIEGTAGLDVNPGSDADADLISVGVTDSPKIWWDESEDKFVATKPINAPQAYGELYVSAAETVALSGVSAGTYVQLTGENVTAGLADGTYVSADATDDQLDVSAAGAGIYHISGAISFSGSTGDTITAAVFVNGAEVAKTKTIRKLGATDVGAVAIEGLVSVAASQSVDLRFKSDSTNNISVQACNLSMMRII